MLPTIKGSQKNKASAHSFEENQSLLLSNDISDNNIICAMKGMLVRYPWKVVKSKNFEGRYYFYNTESNKSLWSFDKLEAAMIIVPSKNTNHEEDQTESNRSLSNAVSKFPFLSLSSSSSSPSSRRNSTVSDRSSISGLDDEEDIDWNRRSSSSSIMTDQRGSIRFSTESATSIIGEDNDEEDPIHYDVTDGLGTGGFSIVLKVQELYSNKCYAMKMINKKTQTMDQTKSELSIMTSNHQTQSPFLQQCHHAFENSTHVFFIIDYHSGGDLFYHLNKKINETKKPFNENEVQFIIAEISLGLEHIHKQGVIHRDIKIENIMLDSKGHVKIVDFGLAINLKDKSSTTNLKNGSLIYTSPELIKNSIVGTFTDLWALGIVTYELITGNSPWSHLTDTNKFDIFNLKVFPPISCSINMSRFILGLLKHDYKKRLGMPEIRSLPLFNTLDWKLLSLHEINPVYIPGNIKLLKKESRSIYTTYLEQMKLSKTYVESDFDTYVSHQKNNDGNWHLSLEAADEFLSI